ncbi:SPASM domain-containing protein [Geoalkalibacter halelectricus]|uniref:SPASM domain-containing protein n=1 Tax=Geoalkalibacter halelectricus TaxID=2847045 RepID=UPI003D1B85FA
MSLDLLDAPLRVTWDLYQPGFGLSRDNLNTLAERLLEAGVFFVWLDGSPVQHPDHQHLIIRLAQGCQVSLTIQPASEDLARLSPGLPLGEVFLDVSALGEADFPLVAGAVKQLRGLGYAPALLLRPSRDNLGLLPLVAQWCRDLGVGRLKLPNAPVKEQHTGPEELGLPGPQEIAALRRHIGDDAAALRKGIDLQVHDLFIWEILFPPGHSDRGEFRGCQAGNSLGHITVTGELYPCASWPLSLGSLLESSLTELWQGALRMAVRSTIARLPAACRGCRDLPVCFGGCRGLAETFPRHSVGRDLMCPGPR